VLPILRGAAIVVLQPNNIIFSEIVPHLDFYKDQRDVARVHDSVYRTLEYVNGLPRLEQGLLFPDCDQGHTADHGPVLCTVPVLLETQPLAWLDDDLLDLVIVTFEEVFVMSPRSVVLPAP
jgi:hypothetical protein